MRLPRKITRRWAQRHGACPDELAVFLEHWPEGAELTRENLLEAAELNLGSTSIHWLALDLICQIGDDEYDAYRDRHGRASRRYHHTEMGRGPTRTYLRACAVALADALGLP